jgi:hypothetical protein
MGGIASEFCSRHWVYAVRRANGDIKIGHTYNLSIRMSALRQKHGAIEILGVTPGSEITEGRIHERFAEHRIRPPKNGRGQSPISDWFTPTPELLDFVRTEMQRYHNPAAKKHQGVTSVNDLVTA